MSEVSDSIKTSSYGADLLLLRAYYRQVIAILDARTDGFLGLDDEALNDYYVRLLALIENILDKPEFATLRTKSPELFDTTLGNGEELDAWQVFTRSYAIRFESLLHKELLKEGSAKDIEADGAITSFFADVQNAIKSYIAKRDAVVARFEARVEENVRGLGWSTAPKASTNKASETIVEQVDIQPLSPNSYSDSTGRLAVSSGVDVHIANHDKARRANGKKYNQCHLMSCLFKSVNTLNSGITFSMFLGVKYDKTNTKHTRKISNTIDEINAKVSEKTTAKKLVFSHGGKIFIDKSYLKK